MSGSDTLGPYPQPDPPDRESGQAAEGERAGERYAVVTANDFWQPESLEESREDHLDLDVTVDKRAVQPRR